MVMRRGVKGGQLKTLGKGEIYDIHLSILRLLEEYGVKVENERCLKILNEAGAKVDWKRETVSIPSYLVEEAIKKAPKSIRLCGRSPDQDFILEGKRVYFGSGTGTTHIYDVFTDEYRRTVKKDVEMAAKISDALPNIDHTWGLFSSLDVPPSAIGLHQLEAIISNTVKHACIYTWHGKPQVESQIEILKLVAGGEEELRKRPLVTLYNEPHSPLTYGEDYLDALVEWAKMGLPQIWYPGGMLGATTPITLAGDLVQEWAESLGGLVIAQLVNPGTPFIVGMSSAGMDMRTTSAVYASAQIYLLAIAIAQMGHFYGLPTFGLGGATDSKILDGQAVAEASTYLTISALSGQNLIHDLGFMGSGLIGSLELLTICDELVAQLKRVMGGIRVDQDTLAVEVIEKVGYGENFLMEEHTIRFLQEEYLASELFDKNFYKNWKEKGGKKLEERAKEKVIKILKDHEVEPLEKDVKKEIEKIIRETERKLSR